MREMLWVEIDLGQIKKNMLDIKKIANKGLIPVIKSNAYNLGDLELIKLVDELGLAYGAVVDMEEAYKLLSYNPNYRILILNSLEAQEYIYLNEFPNLAISINKELDIENFKKANISRDVKAHIQIDTGMNRLGFGDLNIYNDCLERIKQLPNLILEGIYTHFSSLKNANNQVNVFKNYINAYPYEMIHTSASSTFRTIDFGNFVRVGVDVYGWDNQMQSIKVIALPISINNVKEGETIGYDEVYQAEHDIRVAVLPIGYANGFRRSLGGYKILVNNKLYNTIGRVCMNHLFVEIDDEVDLDSEFVITSKEHPIANMANYINTIPHEILCMLNIKNKKYIR